MKPRHRHPASERGFAVIIVLALLMMMAAFVVGNNVVLYQLHQRLRLIEARQLEQFDPPDSAPVVSVQPPHATSEPEDERSELEEIPLESPTAENEP